MCIRDRAAFPATSPAHDLLQRLFDEQYVVMDGKVISITDIDTFIIVTTTEDNIYALWFLKNVNTEVTKLIKKVKKLSNSNIITKLNPNPIIFETWFLNINRSTDSA